VTGANALDTIEALEDSLTESAGVLRADKGNFSDKIRQLVEQNKKLEKEVSQLNMKLASGAGNDLADSAIEVNGIKLIVNRIDGGDPKTLPDVMDRLKNKIQSGIVVLAAVNENKITLIAGVTQDLTETIQAGALVNHVASQVGGKGGGRPDMARAGGSDVEALPNALDSIPGYILEKSTP
jgi:alanyl-tRNA synthetase